ncbi:Eco57I restriction-modification methylase domain-containing protein [Zavarzinella formosa]|uniref:Eco57I restriction-modification methylase domain-containing protein n=1 Tax=Zavarzinella formosa TaxID=360055 RepID=UPI000318219E|nr:hypothetical protein [Zavarzinella formosa]
MLEPRLQTRKAEADFRTIFAPRWDGGALSPSEEPISQRAAWAIVNAYLLFRMAGQKGDLAEAERWFFGGHNLPSLVAYVDAQPALNALERLSFDEDLLELLPYVLEVHGPGSRMSIMRDPTTRSARDAKRENGVFYTPADVAEYQVADALTGHGKDIHCLDPSCGNGVYLVAMLRIAAQRAEKRFDRFAFTIRSLYGFDISALAVECCAFVLLHHCMPKIAPWSAWHAIRLNLAATDSLRFKAVAGETGTYSAAAKTRSRLRRQLIEGGHVERVEEKLPTDTGRKSSLFDEDGLPPLGAAFPETEAGFEVLAGNPPYAAIGHRDDRDVLEQEYASLKSGNGTADLYPPFIESMWRLTKPGNSSATLVVPLSIAFQQSAQFTACRQAMNAHGGRWRFAFFDRQPHALFGEDVKTRNAILFRTELPEEPPRDTTAQIETGPLKKWTSRTRDKLFASVSFTQLHGVSIIDGIPKLCGGEQSQAFTILSARTDTLRSLCERTRTCRPQEATLASEHLRVFVASTAYNFLNVFHRITVEGRHPLSENTVHCLQFASDDHAEMAFAILSSRLTYWLWHVEGDGFHVGGGFIQNLPFGRHSFKADQAEELRRCGRQMWEALQGHRIVSINKGKQTVAYRPLALEKERDAIDELLIDAAKIPKRFKQTLKSFVIDAVVVDDTDARRSHLKSLFDTQEGESS